MIAYEGLTAATRHAITADTIDSQQLWCNVRTILWWNIFGPYENYFNIRFFLNEGFINKEIANITVPGVRKHCNNSAKEHPTTGNSNEELCDLSVIDHIGQLLCSCALV